MTSCRRAGLGSHLRGTPFWRGLPSRRSPRRALRTYASEDRPNGSYPGLMGIAAVGCAETLYLTVSKFLNAPVVCLTSGCDAVINSPYAEVYGIPISLLGLFGYGAVGLCAWECLASEPDWTAKAMVVSSAAVMAACSAVLILTLVTKLDGELCIWCYLSAALSFSAFGLALTTLKSDEKMSILMPSSGLGFLAAVALLTTFNAVDDSAVAGAIVIAYSDPVVTATSDGASVALAKRLRAAGVRMFGAFWCNHCYDQKQSFGKEAMEFFPYVECYPNGYRKGVKVAKACEEAAIQGYPTWVFGTKQLSGEQSMEALQEELAQLESR